VQQGSAEEIYARPRSRFVSTFVGEANIFEAERSAGYVEFAGNRIPSAGSDGRVTIVVRPEHVRLGAWEASGDVALQGIIAEMRYLGAHVKYEVVLPEGRQITATSADRGLRSQMTIGKLVWCGWSLADQWIIQE
jgi:ABC-type Fe3+/spermidine/putrescine transport system ATPase subunit